MGSATSHFDFTDGVFDPTSFLFWDGTHPSSVPHRLFGEFVTASVVPEPQAAILFRHRCWGLDRWTRLCGMAIGEACSAIQAVICGPGD
jgi:phospholipase/lecithinase/hemolysin